VNRASSATGWVRDPIVKSGGLDPTQASSYELGWTFNPITGCLNHTNGLCNGGGFPCYAYKLANGRLRDRYLANMNVAPTPVVHSQELHEQDVGEQLRDPFYPRFWYERVREEFGAWTSGAIPKGIFVCDMSDLFGIGIPEEWTRRILNHIGMSYYKEHRFYLLTKQSQNLINFSPFPDNCWVGVTATNLDMAYMASYHLKEITAKVKYISFEPLLDWKPTNAQFFLSGIVDWVIIGAQTKPAVYPQVEWVEDIVSACDKAGVKVFLKDNLIPLFKGMTTEEQGEYQDILIDHFYAKGIEFGRIYTPEDNKVVEIALRQEMPVGGGR